VPSDLFGRKDAPPPVIAAEDGDDYEPEQIDRVQTLDVEAGPARAARSAGPAGTDKVICIAFFQTLHRLDCFRVESPWGDGEWPA